MTIHILHFDFKQASNRKTRYWTEKGKCYTVAEFPVDITLCDSILTLIFFL